MSQKPLRTRYGFTWAKHQVLTPAVVQLLQVFSNSQQETKKCAESQRELATHVNYHTTQKNCSPINSFVLGVPSSGHYCPSCSPRSIHLVAAPVKTVYIPFLAPIPSHVTPCHNGTAFYAGIWWPNWRSKFSRNRGGKKYSLPSCNCTGTAHSGNNWLTEKSSMGSLPLLLNSKQNKQTKSNLNQTHTLTGLVRSTSVPLSPSILLP